MQATPMQAAMNIHTTIVVPTYNQYRLLSRIVDGLNDTAEIYPHPLELIVVDNNSDDADTIWYLKALADAPAASHFASISVLPFPGKFNYSAINNFAVSKARGEYICLINNDVEVINTDWLEALHKPLQQERTGCVGAMLYYPDDTIQHAGIYLDPKIIAGHLYKDQVRGSRGQDNFLTSDQVVPAVTAAVLLVRKAVYDAVGGFDEAFAVAFNDVDLCLRIRAAGYNNIWTPLAELYHHESKSRGTSKQRSFRDRLRHKREVKLMKKRWRDELYADTTRIDNAHAQSETSTETNITDNITTTRPTVAVVVCTFNGAEHVAEQIKSIESQTWPVDIHIFDDASTDNTIDTIRNLSIGDNITIHEYNDNLGYVRNFERGLQVVLSKGYGYIALSDQDDHWLENRIADGMTAIDQLEKRWGSEKPLLTHSDLVMIDSTGNVVRESFFSYRKYSINNDKHLPTVLGQNGVMGNTVLLNKALAQLALPFPAELHVHDYWLALLAEIYGQRSLVPGTPVQYRIHASNASNDSDSTRFGAYKMLEHKSFQAFIKRDYRLPFKEDSRLATIEKLLDANNGLPALTEYEHNTLSVFKQYLKLEGPRKKILSTMLREGFFRKGLAHRLRLVYSTLLTNRYK